MEQQEDTIMSMHDYLNDQSDVLEIGLEETEDTIMECFSMENSRIGSSSNEESSEIAPEKICAGEEMRSECLNRNILSPEKNEKTRKRPRAPEQWKRNIMKQKVNSGQEHISPSKKIIDAKSVKGTCGDKCKLKCKDKLSIEQQKIINRQFWELADHAKQRSFIAAHTTEINPRYRRVREGSNRQKNLSYSLTWEGQPVLVCKMFFMLTLNVSDTFIRITRKKIGDKGIMEPEKRGKHKNRVTISPDIKSAIRKHIDMFPRIDSQYTWAQTSKQFLDGNLSISEMYRLYLINQQAAQLPIAKKCIYTKIFNEEYNLSFFTQKKDQCTLCEAYKNADEEMKSKMEMEYDIHCKNKDLSREEKRKDIESAKHGLSIVACYYLQSVLQVPFGDVDAFYYKRKLDCYNFTIFETATKSGICYLWDEGTASKGANEISSCVYRFLQRKSVGKDVIFYSDDCVSQNKNKVIVSMYMYAMEKLNIPSITHKFLIIGHAQNEGDTMHAVIEREKKRQLKSSPIYIPTQWIPIIQMARKDGNSYEIDELSSNSFFDFLSLSTSAGRNYNINTNGEKVLWSDIKVIQVRKGMPFTIYYKTDFSDISYKKINIQRQQIDRLTPFQLAPAYSSPPKIFASKKQDLLELCNSNTIPSIYHHFYKNLIADK